MLVGLSTAELYSRASAVSAIKQREADGDIDDEEEDDTSELPRCIGAIALLAAALATSEPVERPAWTPPPASTAIRGTLPLIILGTSSAGGVPPPISSDVLLFWLWTVVLAAVETASPLEDALVFSLVELLTPLCALSPSDPTRFLAFRLIATIILDLTAQEETQLILLRDLLGGECPFEGMRVAAIGLTREVLASKFAQKPRRPSIFVSPLLLEELGPVLFDFRLGEECERVKFVERWLKRTLDQLGLYYFLLVRDADNETGVRSPGNVAATAQAFLDPLRTSLHRWTRDSGSSETQEDEAGRAQVAIELSQFGLVQDALQRIEDALQRS